MLNELILEASSGLFNVICAGLAAAVGYRNRKKFAELKFLYLYPLMSCIELLLPIPVYLIGVSEETSNTIARIAIQSFLLTEFLLIYHFFNQVLSSRIVKHIMQVIIILYSTTILLFLVLSSNSSVHTDILYVLQGIIVLIPCFCYFAELFKKTIVLVLVRVPTFWVATGTLFYFGCTLPLFFMKDFIFNPKGLIQERGLYSINHIFYGVLFLLITKAYLCRKQET